MQPEPEQKQTKDSQSNLFQGNIATSCEEGTDMTKSVTAITATHAKIIFPVTEAVNSHYTRQAYKTSFKRFQRLINIHDLQVSTDLGPKVMEQTLSSSQQDVKVRLDVIGRVAGSLRADCCEGEERAILTADDAQLSRDGELRTGPDVVRTATCAHFRRTWLNDEASGNSCVSK